MSPSSSVPAPKPTLQVAGAHQTMVLPPTTAPPLQCISHFLAASLPLQLSTAHCWNRFLANILPSQSFWPFLVCTWQSLKSGRPLPLPRVCPCLGCCIRLPRPPPFQIFSCFTVQTCCRVWLAKKPDFGFIVSALHLIVQSCHVEVWEFDFTFRVFYSPLAFPSLQSLVLGTLFPTLSSGLCSLQQQSLLVMEDQP